MAPSTLVILLGAVSMAATACGKSKTTDQAPARPEAKPASPRTVKVIVPRKGHLQYMSFYLAKGAGYFRDENVDLQVVYPPKPRDTLQWFQEGDANVAVLPPPMCLQLVSDRFPFVVVANLLENDPIELLVRTGIAEERGLSADAPLDKRLEGVRGLRVGVSPNPPTRLRKLFALHGMDADQDIEMVIIRGERHNEAFSAGEVDALYVHTPFLERAIVEQDVMMLVNQSAGEVPALAGRQIHTLAVRRAYAEANPEIVTALTRAIHRAQKLVHSSPGDAVEALLAEVPDRDRRQIETIVRIYGPAIPATPRVSAEGIEAELGFFPATRAAPDLTGVDLGRFVAPAFAEHVVRGRD